MKKKFLAEKGKQLRMTEPEVIQFIDLAFKLTDEQMPLLQQAIDNGSYIEIQFISHRIKSNFLNLKFDHLGALAQDINLASFLKSDIQAIKRKFDQLKSGYAQLRAEVAEE